MTRESEALLKQVAEILGVPVSDVPKVVRNLLDESNKLDALITQLE
ncbi:MAG: hypothetical protein KAW41_05975 [Candidatus Diapherotrites archaeon]|nr:hypothetical protein [Candidatus Diapherotrites archaeon]